MTSKWTSEGLLFQTFPRLTKPWFWMTLPRFGLIIGVLGAQEFKQILWKTTPAKHMLKKLPLERHLSKKYEKEGEDSTRSGVQISLFPDLATFRCLFCPQTVSVSLSGPFLVPFWCICCYFLVPFWSLSGALLESIFKMALQSWKSALMLCFRAAGFREAYWIYIIWYDPSMRPQTGFLGNYWIGKLNEE